MKFNKFLIYIFILLLLTNTFAQEETENIEDKFPCDMDFALLLVQQQVADAKNTEDTGKRVNILIRSANFLWRFEEEKSRDYFKVAFDVAENR